MLALRYCCLHPFCRGSLSAGQRRIAYDSLGAYQQLQQTALEPLTPDAWAQAARYSKTVGAVLAADGVRWGGESLACFLCCGFRLC